MTYKVIAIAALAIAIAAVIFSIYIVSILFAYIDVIDCELKHLDKTMDNFTEGQMLERKAQRHAEQKN